MSHVLDKPCLCEFAETARWQGLIGKEPGGKRQENHPFDQICCQSIFTSSFSVCFWRSKHARRKFKLYWQGFFNGIKPYLLLPSILGSPASLTMVGYKTQ